jgi:hypothetical protein
MLDDGIYSLALTAAGFHSEERSSALAVLRGGSILGADRWGGVFSGTYAFDPSMRVERVEIRLAIPPDGDTLTGLKGGPDGASVEFSAVFVGREAVARATVDIGGRLLILELAYVGPLPG